ncbi:hypothetical protein ACFE04_001663 [Oxalis oulophora]
MNYPLVDKRLLEELEGMGFTLARAARALSCSGNVSLEVAVNWIIDHENDPDIDEMPLVAMNIDIESPQQTENFVEEMQLKERIRAGKEFLDMKRIAEENERKRNSALRTAEKDEEKTARERIRQKIEADKAERRKMLGLSSKDPAPLKPSPVVPKERKDPSEAIVLTKTEQMRECLRSIRWNDKENDYKVQRAFNTLLTYVGNVAKNPNEEKYRRIRFGNPYFKDRVASTQGGVEFLELCGFKRRGQFFYIPYDKVDLAILNTAGCVLKSAIMNPFFGLFSKHD